MATGNITRHQNEVVYAESMVLGTAGSQVTITGSEFAFLDGASSGSTVSSKAVIANASGGVDITGRLTVTDGVASGTARVVGGNAFVDVATNDTILAASSPAAFASFAQTYVIPANTLKSGSVVRAKAMVFVNDIAASDTLTCQLRLASTTLIATTAVDPISTTDFHFLEFEFVSRAAAGSTVGVVGAGRWTTYASTNVANGAARLASTAFATNGNLTMDVQAKW